MMHLSVQFSLSRFSMVFFISILLLGGTQLAPAFGKGRTPTDVFGQVSRIRANLEVVRGRLGSAENQQLDIPVMNVSPREVFYQAVSLQKKVYQFANEQGVGKENERHIVISEGKLTPGHVFAVVEDAGKRLQAVLEKFNPSEGIVTERVNLKTPTDVFRSIIQANRQFNLMLQTQVVPSDVYQRVQDSIHLVRVLQAQFSPVGLPPQEPLQTDKNPKDVYNRLIKCFNLQREVLRLSNIKVMDLDAGMSVVESMTPADVYDMASLVFSEVRVVYLSMKNRPLTPGVFYPGKKEPSHVYQLVGRLEEMLTALLSEVKEQPRWLTQETRH